MIKNKAETEETKAEEVKKEDASKASAKQKEKSTKQSDKAKLQAKIDELNDKYLRTLAEYDNFKKRTQREKEAIYKDSVGDAVTTLLPVLDNFERAMASFDDESKNTEFYKGMEMIFNQTKEAFLKLGVSPIEAVGSEFNPELHNAVMHVDDEEAGENVIVEEFQKGYKIGDRVVRHSMVKVAN